jgi:hypothetical protein
MVISPSLYRKDSLSISGGQGINFKVIFQLFEPGQGPWRSLSEDPHHNRFHCMSNALLALIIKAVLGRDSS